MRSIKHILLLLFTNAFMCILTTKKDLLTLINHLLMLELDEKEQIIKNSLY